MQLDIFFLDEYAATCLNVSALFFTIAGICTGSINRNVYKAISKAINFLMITVGGIYFLLAIIGSGFTWYEDIKFHMLKIDSNAVLLIALAATIGTIVLGRKYSENRSRADANKIKDLNDEISNLKNKINNKDEKYIELKEKYIELHAQNRSLIEKLNHTTNVMGEMIKKYEGEKHENE